MSFISRKQAAYKQALSGPDGEYLLASLMDCTGFYKQSFSTDPYQTAFNEGKRAVALHIIQFLDIREEDLRNLVRGYRDELSRANTDWGVD
jgi:hypothetical protein